MSRIRVIDTSKDAESIYRQFQDKPYKRHVAMPFTWPRRLQEIGKGRAQMYHSNKWTGVYADYKHIAEGPQVVYATPGFLRDWSNPRRKLKVYGPTVELTGEMPKHFAQLAPLLGVQIQLYGPDGELESDGIYEVTVRHGFVGAAYHPETDETMIFIYTKSDGVHMVFTGTKLDVEKDGIVG